MKYHNCCFFLFGLALVCASAHSRAFYFVLTYNLLLTYALYCGTIMSVSGKYIYGGFLTMKIVGQRYCSASEFLQDSIYQSYNSVSQFLLAFAADNPSDGLNLSKSLVDSWLCGRRKISSSSAALVWKVAGVLCHHSSEHAIYVQMCGLLHGAMLPVYSD